MSKRKRSLSSKIEGWIIGKTNYTVDDDGLFCKVCDKILNCEKQFHVVQHEASEKHRKNSEKSVKQTQRVLEFSGNDSFSMDLCNALILAANIPWAKLDCPEFKSFLEKYCKKVVPNRTTLSKNYLPKCYDDTIKSKVTKDTTLPVKILKKC